MKKLRVGILGFGTVGRGTYQILTENHRLILERTGVDIEVIRIFNRRPKEGLPEKLFTDNASDIISAEDIDLVVEVLGGLEPATTYMLESLKHGKHVVTANKAAVAASFKLLEETAMDNKVQFLFEASVGGGIPVLTAIRNPLQGNAFLEVKGILNGTTNYILTKMAEEGASYENALKGAQEKGFAEADPTADVEGIDAANKLTILMALLFDRYVKPEDIPREGITKVSPEDISKAKAVGKTIKLIAKAALKDGEMSFSVKPEAIENDHPLAGVKNEFNAVYVTGDMVDELMFYGRGAGALPTGSAVVGDIIAVAKSI